VKVALVRYRYSPHGGAERYVDALSAGLAAAGAEVRLLCASWDGASSSAVPVERFPVPSKPAPLRLLLFARAVRGWARRNPGWLLFSLERIPGAQVYRAGDGVHAEWLRRKRVLRPRSWPLDFLRPLNLAYLGLERATFASPALRLVIANSIRGRDEIVRRFGVSPERIAVVRNGVDSARFPPERKGPERERLRRRYGIAAGETVFLFVRSGFARKGGGTIARAARRLSERGFEAFRIVLAGKGDPGPYVREAGPASRRLVFAGPVMPPEPLFLGADAFVFRTIYEPCSNACLEAMAAGLPVVTTAANGASELLAEGVSGYILPDPADPVALGDRMERLLSAEVRASLGERARRIAQAYTLERNRMETLAVLDRAWKASGG